MHSKLEPNATGRPTAVRKLQIDGDDAGQRIDNFLRRHLPGVPKGRLYRLLRRGEVRVNGGRIRAEYKLQDGDEVRIPPVRLEPPGAPPAPHRGEALLERVLFEDKRLLVIDKPSGVAVHGGSGISFGVVELLRAARPDIRDLSLVHRLDRETSGCLVLAKRRSALRELHARFRSGDVSKNYLALTSGDWQYGEQCVDAPLLVTHRKGGERHVIVSDDGKPARTRVRLSRAFGEFSLLQCQPETGRTHQIRVHLAARGHAIVGDERYGDAAINKSAATAGLRRMFLHAQSIAFADDSGNEQLFMAPLADDLERFLGGLGHTRQRRKGRYLRR